MAAISISSSNTHSLPNQHQVQQSLQPSSQQSFRPNQNSLILNTQQQNQGNSNHSTFIGQANQTSQSSAQQSQHQQSQLVSHQDNQQKHMVILQNPIKQQLPHLVHSPTSSSAASRYAHSNRQTAKNGFGGPVNVNITAAGAPLNITANVNLPVSGSSALSGLLVGGLSTGSRTHALNTGAIPAGGSKTNNSTNVSHSASLSRVSQRTANAAIGGSTTINANGLNLVLNGTAAAATSQSAQNSVQSVKRGNLQNSVGGTNLAAQNLMTQTSLNHTIMNNSATSGYIKR